MYGLYATTCSNVLNSDVDVFKIDDYCCKSNREEFIELLDLQILKGKVFDYFHNSPFYMIELEYEGKDMNTINTSKCSIKSISAINKGYSLKFFQSMEVKSLYAAEDAIFNRTFEWVCDPIRCEYDLLSVHARKLYDLEGVIAGSMTLLNHVLNPDDANLLKESGEHLIFKMVSAIAEDYSVKCDVSVIASKVSSLLGFNFKDNESTLKYFIDSHNTSIEEAFILLKNDGVKVYNREVINKLYKQAERELKEFKTYVCSLSKEAIYDSAYKIVTLADFVTWFSSLYNNMLSDNVYSDNVLTNGMDLTVLFDKNNLLDFMYEEWMKSNFNSYNDIDKFIDYIC